MKTEINGKIDFTSQKDILETNEKTVIHIAGGDSVVIGKDVIKGPAAIHGPKLANKNASSKWTVLHSSEQESARFMRQKEVQSSDIKTLLNLGLSLKTAARAAS